MRSDSRSLSQETRTPPSPRDSIRALNSSMRSLAEIF
jgi:hypothetical protein